MATRTFSGSGNWSTAGNWNTPPVDGDAIIIAAGAVCTMDVDITSWATGVAGATLNGTLVWPNSLPAGSYGLKMSANFTFGSNGIFQIGDSLASPLPVDRIVTIVSTGVPYLSGGAISGAIKIYCAQPTWGMVQIAAASAGATSLTITGYRRMDNGVVQAGQDLTTDPMWAAPRSVRIADVSGTLADVEAINISSVSSSTITLASALAADKGAGTWVVLTWRNVRFTGYSSTVGMIYNALAGTVNCEVALGAGGRGITSVLASNVASVVHGGQYSFSGFFEARLLGIGIAASSAGMNSSTGAIVTLGGALLGAPTAFTACYATVVENGGLVAANNTGVSNSIVELRAGGVLMGNTSDMTCGAGGCQIRGTGGSMNSSVQVSSYLYDGDPKGTFQNVVYNIGDVPRAYPKGWMAGGRLLSDLSNLPTGTSIAETLNLIFEQKSGRLPSRYSPCWLDTPVYVRSGQRVTMTCWMRKDTNAMTVTPRIQWVDPAYEFGAAGGLLSETVMADNTVWQRLTVTYKNTGPDRMLAFRVTGTHNSGNAWAAWYRGDYDMQERFGGRLERGQAAVVVASLADSGDGQSVVSPDPGTTLTVQVSKAGGALQTVVPASIVALEAARSWALSFNAGTITDTPGELTVRSTCANGTVDYVHYTVEEPPFTRGAVTDAAPTATSFAASGLSAANIGQMLVFVSGALSGTTGRKISGYAGGVVSVQTAFGSAPTTGDRFVTIGGA